MDAYVHTDLEDTEAQIVKEAIASISHKVLPLSTMRGHSTPARM